jgi:hypothetical protein
MFYGARRSLALRVLGRIYDRWDGDVTSTRSVRVDSGLDDSRWGATVFHSAVALRRCGWTAKAERRGGGMERRGPVVAFVGFNGALTLTRASRFSPQGSR